MKKKLLFLGCFLVTILSFFLINALNTGAESKKTLEEIVMDQQMTIEKLQSQLSQTQERIASIEKKQIGLDQYESRLSKIETTIGESDSTKTISQQISSLNGLDGRISTLERIQGIDAASIQNYIKRLPEEIGNTIDFKVNEIYLECDNFGNPICGNPIEKDNLTFTIWGGYYNVLDYLTKEEISEIAKASYNEKKQPDKLIIHKLKIGIEQPFGAESVWVDVPLD